MSSILTTLWLGAFLFLIVATKIVPSTLGCLESEEQALLMLKRGLIDEANRLASWQDLVNGKGCCEWLGITCDNSTGRVIGLHLQNGLPTSYITDYYSAAGEREAYRRSQLRGVVSPSLLHLKHLMYLNFSGNDFGGTRIPSFFGSMRSLKYLDLSNAGFGGEIPPHIGNLTNLIYLNLGGLVEQPFPVYDQQRLSGLLSSVHLRELAYPGLSGNIPYQIGNLTNLKFLGLEGSSFASLYTQNLQWISGISSLRNLDFSHLDLSMAIDWLNSINTLPSLLELRLSECQLTNVALFPLRNNLSSLVSLDLSGNALNDHFPKWIYHLRNLNTLDLSYNEFLQVPIPEGLQNMTYLKHLDLSSNSFNSSVPNWMYSFSTGLEFLSLEQNGLQGVISTAVGNLTSLTELRLGGNRDLKVDGRETTKSIGRLCNMKSLSLSGMELNQDVADIFNDLSLCASNGLKELSLSFSGIIGNLTNARFADFKALAVLDLEGNSISGSIPPAFGNLQSLTVAKFNKNLLSGAVSEAQFRKLNRLRLFKVDENQEMELKINPSWVPPFQLKELRLPSWKLAKQFPTWLRSQRDLELLDLSNCSIADAAPKWFWNLSMPLLYLDLSNNQISGEIPMTTSLPLQVIDLSNNQLTGQVPLFSSSLYQLDLSSNLFDSVAKGFWNSFRQLSFLNLSHNQISGKIPPGRLVRIGEGGIIDLSSNNFHSQVPLFSPSLSALDLSNNSFSGSLSNFLCYELNEPKQLTALNLGDNSLYGEIPDCWTTWNGLTALKLNNNNFTGRIPSSLGSLSLLESLHLRNNSLVGGLPSSLRSCHNLLIVDLAENQLEGKIPAWFSKFNLKILNFRLNEFCGRIPDEICSVTTLQILDFAYNNLSGHLPQCINNFTAMVANNSTMDQFSEWPITELGSSLETAILVIKGRTMEYSTTLDLVRVLDFSSNFLSGGIPDEVTTLTALQSLNLSNNHFMGGIPRSIGAMKSLESLDLSKNRLSGEIPTSMSSLTFLSHLNLSSNNLTGRIPSSTQLQSFNASSFAGNGLCGPPVSRSCNEGGIDQLPSGDDTSSNTPSRFVDVEWFSMSMALGFFFGFCGFVFPILFSRNWRLAFYSFLNRVLSV